MKTYAPIFPGFYETEFGMNMDMGDVVTDLIENLEFRDNEKTLVKKYIMANYDDCVFTDYKSYENDVAEHVCQFLSDAVSQMLNTDVKFEFEEIVSPQYYNFKNDSINVNLKCDTDVFMRKLLAFIKEHYNEFKEYIDKNYTSCDGFISFYSNDVDDWIKGEYGEHEIGSMLEFALRIWNKQIYTEMVYYVMENAYEGCAYTLTEKFEKMLETEKFKDILKEYNNLCKQKEDYTTLMKSQGKQIDTKAVDISKIEDKLIEEIQELFEEI